MYSIWSKVTEEPEKKLELLGKPISFNPPKNDDSYVKAKTGFGYSSWTFAKTQGAVWLELELKPIKKVPQEELCNFIKSKKSEIKEKHGLILDFSDGGNDRRIKAFIENRGMSKFNKEECIEKMVSLVTVLQPIIAEYYEQRR